MNTLKKLRNATLILLMGAFVLTSCNDDEEDPQPTPPPTNNNIVVSGKIESNTTWTADEVYELAGRVIVASGVTLTIDPGAVIKGRTGQGALASSLVIARGAKIMAMGTETQPIIFTAVNDQIQPGQIVSPNLNETFNNLWGGLIILGNAPISADAAEVQIEGIPADIPEGLYGGSDVSDDSGIIRYVSVRHGGTLIGGGNEINGITLGGVGNSTVVDHVEVVGNLDDGIECFGGSVNISNALVWAQGDDAYDIDQAYTGTIDNFIYIAGNDSDHALEIDGPEGTTSGGCTFRNGSLQGVGGEEGPEYADFRDGAEGAFENLYFFNFSGNSDVELDDDAASMNYTNGILSFTGWEFTTSHLANDPDISNPNLTVGDIFSDNSDIATAFDNLTDANAKIVDSPTVGADVSVFGWTMAAQTGALDNF